MTSGCSLSRIPEDIWLHVLTFLDFKQLCCMSYISRQMKQLATDDSIWKQRCLVDFGEKVCGRSQCIHHAIFSLVHCLVLSLSHANAGLVANNKCERSLQSVLQLTTGDSYVTPFVALNFASSQNNPCHCWSVVETCIICWSHHC